MLHHCHDGQVVDDNKSQSLMGVRHFEPKRPPVRCSFPSMTLICHLCSGLPTPSSEHRTSPLRKSPPRISQPDDVMSRYRNLI